MAPCETWDNATLLCEAVDPSCNELFPMTLRTHRIAPGERNTWYLEILGTEASARFSTKDPKRLEVFGSKARSRCGCQTDLGYDAAFKTITGGIFEFGFGDAILQMWAAFLYEVQHGQPRGRFAGCVTPAETALSHRLFTAALESQEKGTVVGVLTLVVPPLGGWDRLQPGLRTVPRTPVVQRRALDFWVV